jgi:beta-glucanase (GH16 family)
MAFQIIDPQGNVFTIGPGHQVAINGTVDTASPVSQLLLFWYQRVYAQTGTGSWFIFVSAGTWTPVGADPRTQNLSPLMQQTVTGLQPGTAYLFDVFGFDAAGNGPASAPPVGGTTVARSIAIATILSQHVNTTFTISGTLTGYTQPPTLQYQDNGTAGTWLPLPSGATVTATSFSFIHPAMQLNSAATVSVQDTNAPTVVATSNAFNVAQVTIFDDEFTSATWLTHQTSQTGDLWSYGAADNTVGQPSGTNSWWANPLNPNTIVASLDLLGAGGLQLGVMTTPPAEQAFITAGNGGVACATVGSLLTTQLAPGGIQFRAYYAFAVSVPRIPGFGFQIALQSPKGVPWTEELDVGIWTDASGVQTLQFKLSGFNASTGQFGNVVYSTTSASGFDPRIQHEYGIEWTVSIIRFYIDGILVAQQATPTDGSFNGTMTVFMMTAGNYALGNVIGLDPAPASLPAYATVRYVRIYQGKPTSGQFILISTIPAENTLVTFPVSGTLVGYAVAPTLQYQDNQTGSWLALPSGSTVSTTAFSFTHPAVGSAIAAMVVGVRDANTITVAALSNPFAVTVAGTVTLIGISLSNNTFLVPTGGAPSGTAVGTISVQTTGGTAPPGSGTTFFDDFSSIPWATHQTQQAGDKWGWITTSESANGEAANSSGFWPNPNNPQSLVPNLVRAAGGHVQLGILNMPSNIRGYLSTLPGGNVNYIGTLINDQLTNLQLHGYWVANLAVPRIPGFGAQWNIENGPATPWSSEIDVDIITRGDNTQHVICNVSGWNSGGYWLTNVFDTTSIDATVKHAYGIEWTASIIRIYIDDVVFGTFPTPTDGTYNNPMFCYLNVNANAYGDVSIGVDPNPASLPAYMDVYDVSVYTSKPTGGPGGGGGPSAFTGTLAKGGTNAANFQIAGSTLQTLGTDQAGNYSVTITATQAGATGSPLTSAPFTITGTATGASNVSVNLASPVLAGIGGAQRIVPKSIWGLSAGFNWQENCADFGRHPALKGTLALAGGWRAIRINANDDAANMIANGGSLSNWIANEPAFMTPDYLLIPGVGPGAVDRSDAQYASDALALVQYMENNHGRNPTNMWIEVDEEPDGNRPEQQTANTFVAVADVIHAHNAAYKVGGPTTSYWPGTNNNGDTFLSTVGSKLGFLCYHSYTSHTGEPHDQYYSSALSGFGLPGARTQMRNHGISDSVPILLGEANMEGRPEVPMPEEATYVGMLYDALAAVDNYTRDVNWAGYLHWDGYQDNYYGLTGNAANGDDDTIMIPTGYWGGYFSRNMAGGEVTSSTSLANLQVLATMPTPTTFAIHMVNYDLNNNQTVTIGLAGGTPQGTITKWTHGKNAPGGNAPTITTIPNLSGISVPSESIVMITGSISSVSSGQPPGSIFWATFPGNTIDRSKWNLGYFWQPDGGGTDSGGGFTASVNNIAANPNMNVYVVANNTVQVQVKPAPDTSKTGGAFWLNGLLNTHDAFTHTYGYWEVTAKLIHNKGCLSAIWLFASDEANWPKEEVDITETASSNPTNMHMTSHPDNTANPQDVTTADEGTGFHKYGINWTASTLEWYFDRNLVVSGPTPASINGPMYLLISTYVNTGGAWWGGDIINAGDPWPDGITVQDVTVWPSKPF